MREKYEDMAIIISILFLISFLPYYVIKTNTAVKEQCEYMTNQEAEEIARNLLSIKRAENGWPK